MTGMKSQVFNTTGAPIVTPHGVVGAYESADLTIDGPLPAGLVVMPEPDAVDEQPVEEQPVEDTAPEDDPTDPTPASPRRRNRNRTTDSEA